MNDSAARILPVIAIAGNPNSGETALFNAITGARQHGQLAGSRSKKEGRVTQATSPRW